MTLKIKKLVDQAEIPTKAHQTDAGFDLVCTSIEETRDCLICGTGLAAAIPISHVGLLFPRSSVYKYSLNLANCVGVVDSGYRGEIKLIFRKTGEIHYRVGDRIGQLLLVELPSVNIMEVDDLDHSDRGELGFGSSGS